MATLYSTLFAHAKLPFAAGTISYGPVPAGNIWVVRDIEAYNYSAFAESALYEFTVMDDGGTPLFVIPGGAARGRKQYSWRGRQVLVASDHINVTTNDGGWSYRISGYQLTI